MKTLIILHIVHTIFISTAFILVLLMCFKQVKKIESKNSLRISKIKPHVKQTSIISKKKGEIVRDNRIKVKLTQRALSKKVGVSAAQISRLEAGKIVLPVYLVEKMSKILKIDTNNLL